MRRPRRARPFIVALGTSAALAAAACRASTLLAPPAAATIAEFGQRLETLRERSHIPAISAVITTDTGVVWSRGFGIADLATGRAATDSTVYHLASLTKPYASTVLLQLVEEGRVSLDDPVSKYGIVLASPAVVRVRHLASHTSEGVPGTRFVYNGARYSLLDSVIARATGGSFAAALDARVLRRIGVHRTAPNPQAEAFSASSATTLDRAAFAGEMARGYTYDGSRYVPTAYPASFSPAAGLTASALDVAAFASAMDRDALLRPATKALAYAPAVTPAGDTLPYALGWFATRYRGLRVIWHYGYWTANSALVVKVPERRLTFVVLANSDALSSPYPLGAGTLEASPWAREFLDAVIDHHVP